MSKKSRLKRKKFQFTKSEFMMAVCSNCKLCKPNTDPIFCYDNIYVENPKRFHKQIYPQLLETRHWMNGVGYGTLSDCPDADLENIIDVVFCDEIYCKNSDGKGGCIYIIGCVNGFRNQIKTRPANIKIVDNNRPTKKKKSRWKKPAKVYVPPKPAFFCNDGFREEINSIINGSNSGQQSSRQESTACNKTASVGEAKDNQS
jgi:hypothetical protein